MRFGACIDTLYTELDWYDRIAVAKRDGFDAAEFWDCRSIDLDRTADIAKTAGILISGFNCDADYSLVDPTHRDAYFEYLHQSIETALKLGAPSVTIHSNALGEGGVVVNCYEDLGNTVKLCSMIDTLKAFVALAEKYGVRLNLEALNTHIDHVCNFLQYAQMGAEIIRLIGSDKLRILYDAYHMQYGDVDTAIVMLKSANSAIGVIDNSRAARYGYDQRVEVHCDKGSVQDGNDLKDTSMISTADGVEIEKPTWFFLERYNNALIAESIDFVNAVRDGADVPVGGHDGLMSVAVAIAAKKSFDEKRSVTLSEILC